ncbi:thioredoxin family protein [Campylobacterota bacterium DY0563]
MKKILLLVLFFALGNLFAFEHLTKDNFIENIKGKNVIVDFYATWCPPCKILAGTLEDFDKVKPKNVTIYKVDIDQYRNLAISYGVKALPTLAYFEDGELVTTEVGLKSVKDLEDSVKEYFE